MDERIKRIDTAAQYIESRLEGRKPVAAIILGSGLGQLAEIIEERITIPYTEIPCFPVSTVIGHKGNFICGYLGGKCVLAMQGRFHYYEGYDMTTLTLPVRVMSKLGVKFLLVSNAAGALNPDYKVGDTVIIRDHINFMPNPLIGANMDDFGPRFPDMTCAYDLELQQKALEIAAGMGIKLNQGVYFGGSGPTYETPAEVRFFRAVGADLVGMSTVPEVIVARHCGIRVFGMSVVTNIANTENVERNFNDGEDVVQQANAATRRMIPLFTKLIESL
ncbi:MAG: purine-nucleoside phosphorylase [Bacteroidales bacterium]|nr:purine-nucleoside phosphorylase [Bacteroidales bacterium]